MSRKSSFANLRDRAVSNTALTADGSVDARGTPDRPISREGRKQIAGFFTTDMSFAMHMLARRQGKSLQSLMGEAFNDVLRKYGESPIGD